MYKQISQAMADPQKLEALYREHPKAFKEHFQSVFAEHPNSVILQVWHERLTRHEAFAPVCAGCVPHAQKGFPVSAGVACLSLLAPCDSVLRWHSLHRVLPFFKSNLTSSCVANGKM